ncbi:tyrosine-type recombinase/integrase [Collimonas antrihumi]|uniref:tyrosine-type recombinase/integrase n=1 Tax=Collimonas antrihumi TaxID=1940615 RepID=UPI001B8AB466|nr:tyrosine-type recombinase/integrase [Collimonas antrihumi]
MNTLQLALQRYVAMRRGLGFKFQQQEKRLTNFVRFMEERGATVITHKLALEWAMLPQDRRPSWALRLTDVRGFARHLHSLEAQTEVLPTGILPGPSRAKPYIYTDTEIRTLLAAALELPPTNGLRRWTYYCLFGLLSVTGLRISEALSLRRDDVDLAEGILTIRDTKFGKSRLVPLHATSRHVLVNYAQRRDAHLSPARSPYFFVAEQGGKLLLQYVYKVFWRLSRQTGLRGQTDHNGPRLHDFRHRFAVQTLLNCYRSDRSVELILPALSTYLGHTCVRDTYWYLSACPELMGHTVRKLEQHWERTS